MRDYTIYLKDVLVESTAKICFTTKGTKEHEVFSNNCALKFKIFNCAFQKSFVYFVSFVVQTFLQESHLFTCSRICVSERRQI